MQGILGTAGGQALVSLFGGGNAGTAGIPAIGWQYPRHFGGSDHIFFARMGENIIFRKKSVYKSKKVFDTICRATIERQSEAKQLAQSADAIVVVGGLQSANTTALAALCGSYCPTVQVETADQLERHREACGAPALRLLPALQPRLVSLRRFKKFHERIGKQH